MLYNGDCLAILKDISDNSVDLFILDLPYGQTACEWDTKIDLTNLWIEMKRIARSPKTAFIFFTTTKFGFDLIQSNKNWFKYDLVWHKPNSTSGFLNSNHQPLRSHEMIYIFYNKPPYYNILDNHQRITQLEFTKNSKDNDVYNTYKHFKSLPKCKIWEPQLPRSLLVFNPPKGRGAIKHSTQKPQTLLEWILKYYSKEGDVVLDPTMGVGSTGVACKKMNRQFIGIELNKEFFDIATNSIL